MTIIASYFTLCDLSIYYICDFDHDTVFRFIRIIKVMFSIDQWYLIYITYRNMEVILINKNMYKYFINLYFMF